MGSVLASICESTEKTPKEKKLHRSASDILNRIPVEDLEHQDDPTPT